MSDYNKVFFFFVTLRRRVGVNFVFELIIQKKTKVKKVRMSLFKKKCIVYSLVLPNIKYLYHYLCNQILFGRSIGNKIQIHRKFGLVPAAKN